MSGTAMPTDDPMAGAADAAPVPGDMGGDTEGSDSDVLVTIARGPDGGYMVYAGDEPEEGGAGDAEGAEGEPATPPMGMAGVPTAGAGGGKPADTIGAALKAALDILNEDQNSSGGEGSSEDQLAAGYSADQGPTPAAPRSLKYPPAAA